MATSRAPPSGLHPRAVCSAFGGPLLEALTPRLLNCSWNLDPQAGTTDENKRGLSGITYPGRP